MMPRGYRVALSGAAIVLMVAGGTLLGGAATRFERISAAATRVQAEPAPIQTPTATQAVVPAATPFPRQAPNCTAMRNPGGRVRWEPTSDAGPWPTAASVQVPSLGVQAPIVKVDVNGLGEMTTPKNARDVAWLDQGPWPGQTQNIVLAGHINWSGVRGSFSSIDALNPGDEIVLERDGQRWVFAVTWNCAFAWNSDFADQIMGFTEAPSVTLISCGGYFSQTLGTHVERIAIRAELVDGSF